ncbi:MAG: hypothetical protein K2G67_01600 [Muribaculaceae bacterium]|nr:hypothetical protein [Muribaculaceae bacterium]
MDIQKDWRDTRFRNSSHLQIDDILNGRRMSALGKLSSKYKRFSIIGFVMIAMSFITKFTVGDNTLGIWISILFACYFATCSAMDYWLYLGISRIDPATMSVNEVITKSLFYRKRHFQFMAIIIPWMIAIIGLIVYANFSDVYMLIAVATGGIIGLAIGLKNLFEFLDAYKTLSN